MPLYTRDADGSSSAEQQPQLDTLISDPVLSPAIPTSQSRSRRRGIQLEHSIDGIGENDPLLGGQCRKMAHKKPFYRPRPLWIVPFAILASITRGMTIAPRVEVFTQLSCNAVYGHPPHFNHSTEPHDVLAPSQPLNLIQNVTSIQSTIPSAIDNDKDGSDEGAGGDDDDDPLRVPSKKCLSDPRVQSYAARLQTIMATTVGVCTTLSTGWWGHFGERHGRTRVLAAATFGLLLMDLVFVLVSLPRSPLAVHGHKLLIVAPAIEGILGGWSTLQGATSAYISDCTSDGSRAHIFSRFMGVFYFGFAMGPMLGAWVITHPPSFLEPLLRLESASVGRTVTPVFWLAVLFSLANFLLSVFVIPESLTKKKNDTTSHLNSAIVSDRSEEDQGAKSASGGILSVMGGIFTPLLVFAPKIRPNGRDWNMTLLALALFGYLLSSGIFQVKYLYAEHVFAWEAEQLSYYITFVGGARAVHLLFFMPLVIQWFKPKPKKTSTTLQNTAGGGNKKRKPTKAQLIAEMKFDLRITRLSYALDILSHTLVSLSSTAPTSAAQAAFVGFTVLSSFSSGTVPGMQSLALCVMQTEAAEDERLGVTKPGGASPGVATGNLFGALAVLQATGQMILGPMLFGLVYSTTVARFPKAIFVLAASVLLISFVLLWRVHPHSRSSHSHPRDADMRKHYHHYQVITRGGKGKSSGGVRLWNPHGYSAYRSGPEHEPERGRSRISKDLSGSSYPHRPNDRNDFRDGVYEPTNVLEAGRAYDSTGNS